MEIAVFGAGNIGSLIGGILARDHTVTLVGRAPHMTTIKQSGLEVRGAFKAHTTPTTTTDGTGLSADLAIVTVKAFDTSVAAKELATGSFETVLSLQNGLRNETLLADQLDVPVLAGTTTYGAMRPEPGVVECTGRGNITIGAREGGTSTLAEQVGEGFQAVGLSTRVVEDMPRRLWRKTAVNAGINPVTALLDSPNGQLQYEPARSIAFDATTEVVTVGRAAGIDLSQNKTIETLDTVIEQTASNISSMAQDLRAGRQTEIDAITGAVLEYADHHDITAATNDLLYRLIKARESVCYSE